MTRKEYNKIYDELNGFEPTKTYMRQRALSFRRGNVEEADESPIYIIAFIVLVFGSLLASYYIQ